MIAVLVVAFGAILATGAAPKLGLDLSGGTTVTLRPTGLSHGEVPSQQVLEQAATIIRQRVDALGVSEATVATQPPYLVVTVPGSSRQQVLSTVGRTAQLEFRQVADTAPETAPKPGTPTPAVKPAADVAPAVLTQKQAVAAFATLNCSDPAQRSVAANVTPASWAVGCGRPGDAEKYLLEPTAVMGTSVATASAQPSTASAGRKSFATGAWEVDLSFRDHAFADLTEKTAGGQTRVAVVLDGEVESAPSNQTAIEGNAQITGNFTQTEATALANALKYGSLPLSFDSGVTSETISPTLGHSSLIGGLLAAGIGLAVVLLYCLFYYRSLVVVTVASLATSAALIYAAIVALGATVGFRLSLAGIAGLIIGIGVTADSFVVYFERIRDEVRAGRTVRSAARYAWPPARRTTLSADVVALLAAAILYVVSAGSVRGFALTLGLTTAVDLGVLFFVTRPLVELLIPKAVFASGRLSRLGSERTPADPDAGWFRRTYAGQTQYAFSRHRRRFYAFSSTLVLIGLAVVLVKGLTFGIDFKGGSEYALPSHGRSPVAAQQVLDRAGAAEGQVQTLGSGGLRVTTGTQTAAEVDATSRALAAAYDVPVEQVTVSTVGPTWGGEVTHGALVGLLVFLAAVTIYLAMRFEPAMAAAALVALLHDIALTVGVYALVGFVVTPATVIALLTVLGFSLYDTVIVFDRVRELSRGRSSRTSYAQAADMALNQTLSRSLTTSFIALLPVAGLLFAGSLFLGAGTLKDLALAQFVGILAGTYSSLFIATPVLVQIQERRDRNSRPAARATAPPRRPARV